MDTAAVLQHLHALTNAAVQQQHIDAQTSNELVWSLKNLLEHDLVGNRVLGARLWDVVKAMEQAFPLLLGAAVCSAEQAARNLGQSAAENHWIRKGVQDGSLQLLLRKLPSQPQVLAAYSRTAVVRRKPLVEEVQACLQQLQGLTFDVPVTSQLLTSSAHNISATSSPAVADAGEEPGNTPATAAQGGLPDAQGKAPVQLLTAHDVSDAAKPPIITQTQGDGPFGDDDGEALTWGNAATLLPLLDDATSPAAAGAVTVAVEPLPRGVGRALRGLLASVLPGDRNRGHPGPEGTLAKAPMDIVRVQLGVVQGPVEGPPSGKGSLQAPMIGPPQLHTEGGSVQCSLRGQPNSDGVICVLQQRALWQAGDRVEVFLSIEHVHSDDPAPADQSRQGHPGQPRARALQQLRTLFQRSTPTEQQHSCETQDAATSSELQVASSQATLQEDAQQVLSPLSPLSPVSSLVTSPLHSRSTSAAVYDATMHNVAEVSKTIWGRLSSLRLPNAETNAADQLRSREQLGRAGPAAAAAQGNQGAGRGPVVQQVAQRDADGAAAGAGSNSTGNTSNDAACPPEMHVRRMELLSQLRELVAGLAGRWSSTGETGALNLKTPVPPVSDSQPEAKHMVHVILDILTLGLQEHAPRQGLRRFRLPGRKPSTWQLLEEAASAAASRRRQTPPPSPPTALPDAAEDLGVHPIAQLSRGVPEQLKSELWVRASLNERALSGRVLALYRQEALMQAWYHSWAILADPDLGGQLVGLLSTLDAVPFLLAVDPTPPQDPFTTPQAPQDSASMLDNGDNRSPGVGGGAALLSHVGAAWTSFRRRTSGEAPSRSGLHGSMTPESLVSTVSTLPGAQHPSGTLSPVRALLSPVQPHVADAQEAALSDDGALSPVWEGPPSPLSPDALMQLHRSYLEQQERRRVYGTQQQMDAVGMVVTVQSSSVDRDSVDWAAQGSSQAARTPCAADDIIAALLDSSAHTVKLPSRIQQSSQHGLPVTGEQPSVPAVSHEPPPNSDDVWLPSLPTQPARLPLPTLSPDATAVHEPASRQHTSAHNNGAVQGRSNSIAALQRGGGGGGGFEALLAQGFPMQGAGGKASAPAAAAGELEHAAEGRAIRQGVQLQQAAEEQVRTGSTGGAGMGDGHTSQQNKVGKDDVECETEARDGTGATSEPPCSTRTGPPGPSGPSDGLRTSSAGFVVPGQPRRIEHEGYAPGVPDDRAVTVNAAIALPAGSAAGSHTTEGANSVTAMQANDGLARAEVSDGPALQQPDSEQWQRDGSAAALGREVSQPAGVCASTTAAWDGTAASATAPSCDTPSDVNNSGRRDAVSTGVHAPDAVPEVSKNAAQAGVTARSAGGLVTGFPARPTAGPTGTHGTNMDTRDDDKSAVEETASEPVPLHLAEECTAIGSAISDDAMDAMLEQLTGGTSDTQLEALLQGLASHTRTPATQQVSESELDLFIQQHGATGTPSSFPSNQPPAAPVQPLCSAADLDAQDPLHAAAPRSSHLLDDVAADDEVAQLLDLPAAPHHVYPAGVSLNAMQKLADLRAEAAAAAIIKSIEGGEEGTADGLMDDMTDLLSELVTDVHNPVEDPLLGPLGGPSGESPDGTTSRYGTATSPAAYGRLLDDMSSILMDATDHYSSTVGSGSGPPSPRALSGALPGSDWRSVAVMGTGTWAVQEVRIPQTEAVSGGFTGGGHTLYVVEVTLEDGTAWIVKHRFSDFTKLHSGLKRLPGVVLPQSWADVSKARAVTGSSRMSAEVIAARRVLLERCLQQTLHAPGAALMLPVLMSFLQPTSEEDIIRGPGLSSGGCQGPGGSHSTEAPAREHLPSLLATLAGGGMNAVDASAALEGGGRVTLRTDAPPVRTEGQLLQMQKGCCAGCHAPLLSEPTAMSFKGGKKSGWRQPARQAHRCCDYTGLLYCHQCHTGQTATLPFTVLHDWDFGKRPVCSLVADYLDGLTDKPLLCIAAVNPGLYARVPVLAKAQEMRVKGSKALQAAHGKGSSSAKAVQSYLDKLGSRAYLLQGAEFWAMKDLKDLSQGAFSDLPHWLARATQNATALATSALLNSKP